MSQPEIVQADLADEDVVARVDLGGEDELYVTPTRTLLYRAEGLLSDESVEEYPHEAERVTVSEGRRKAKVKLDYGLDGEKTISLPAKRLERALQPIVEGVLKANGVLEADEPMERLFRFSELTIAIAGERVVRHIGASLWDEDCETYHYGDVSDLDFEDGSVATSVVLTVNGRQERFKAPNDEARAVRAALETSLLSYWGVDSVEELRAAAEPDEDEPEEAADDAQGRDVSFGDGPDPLIADPAEPEELPENATRSEDAGESGSEPPAGTPDAVAQQVERPTESEAETDPLSAEQATGSAKDAPSRNEPESPSERQPRATSESQTGQERDSTTGASAEAEETDPGDAVASWSEPPREAEEGRTTPASEATGPAAADPAREPSEDASHGERSDASAGGTGTAPGQERPDQEATPAQRRADAGFAGSGFESAAPAADERILDELADLRETVERQNAELQAQRELVEQLIEELRRGR
ncbi:DUF7115 domain-containing protein [Halobellus rarus]|uniref:DUF7115 domain-containing protein n=1 Tax=Halobellus rarus TaxID=1126237 RepID=A0ABD6CQ49_9EURY|nr:hypothetical protein [Halobellus rarus]